MLSKSTPIITIHKKKYPVYFGLAALADFEKSTGIGLAQMGSYAAGMPLKDSLELAYQGLRHGARRTKTICSFENAEELADYMDDTPEILTEVMVVFTDQYAPKQGENLLAEDDKKKLIEAQPIQENLE